MRIVLDMNISPIWEKFLNDAGHEAVHWSKIGDIRAQDVEIMQWAAKKNFLVFTHDLDFSCLLYATGAKAPRSLSENRRFQKLTTAYSALNEI